MTGARIALLQEDGRVCQFWKQRFMQAGFETTEAASADTAMYELAFQLPSLFVCGELRGDGALSFKFMRQVRDLYPEMPIIFVATYGSEELAVRALRAGVNDYVSQSLRVEELVAAVTRVLGKPHPPPIRLAGKISDERRTLERQMIGDSVSMRNVKSCLARIAGADSNVLITGETGTGKELAAQFIHDASPRKQKPLVCINCAAIPDSLVESELFGYERGAFTGAVRTTAGQIERADGGTVFLDEVGEMSPFAQAKLLRVIEGKVINRLGGRASIRLDVRFIAATNQDLETLAAENRFRQDLYFRLNISCVHLPSLRDRKEDIRALSHHYLGEMNRRFGRNVAGFTDDAYARRVKHNWPGNIRELKNLLEGIFVNLPDQDITFIDLPSELCRRMDRGTGAPATERDFLLSALLRTKWNKSEAAKQLHWSRMTLYRKIAKYQIPA
jgi:DNA-binding NtrC family response regulator